MERLWKMSLVFLLLGNTFDGLATHWGVQVYGVAAEVDKYAHSILMNHGLGVLLVGKLVVIGVGLPLLLLSIGMLVRVCLGDFYGMMIPSVLALWAGVLFFLCGLGWSVLSTTVFPICDLLVSLLVAPPTLLLLLSGCYLLCLLGGREVGGLVGRLLKLF